MLKHQPLSLFKLPLFAIKPMFKRDPSGSEDISSGPEISYRACRRGEHDFIPHLERAGGQDNEACEKVLQDFPASKTHRKTTHSSDGQHRIDCKDSQTVRRLILVKVEISVSWVLRPAVLN